MLVNNVEIRTKDKYTELIINGEHLHGILAYSLEQKRNKRPVLKVEVEIIPKEKS